MTIDIIMGIRELCDPGTLISGPLGKNGGKLESIAHPSNTTVSQAVAPLILTAREGLPCKQEALSMRLRAAS